MVTIHDMVTGELLAHIADSDRGHGPSPRDPLREAEQMPVTGLHEIDRTEERRSDTDISTDLATLDIEAFIRSMEDR